MNIMKDSEKIKERASESDIDRRIRLKDEAWVRAINSKNYASDRLDVIIISLATVGAGLGFKTAYEIVNPTNTSWMLVSGSVLLTVAIGLNIASQKTSFEANAAQIICIRDEIRKARSKPRLEIATKASLKHKKMERWTTSLNDGSLVFLAVGYIAVVIGLASLTAKSF